MHEDYSHLNCRQGFTLIEVMLCIFISSILVAGMTTTYLLMQKRNVLLDQNRLHYTRAIDVISLIRNEVRQAGNIGCRQLAQTFRVAPYHDYTLSLSDSIKVSPQSLLVSYQAFPGSILVKDVTNPRKLYVDTGKRFHSGRVLLISDCNHAEIFRADHVSQEKAYQVIKLNQALQFSYSGFAEVAELKRNEYHSNNGLIRTDIRGSHMVIVRDIENFKASKIQNGVSIEFDTVIAGNKKHWYGYAAR